MSSTATTTNKGWGSSRSKSWPRGLSIVVTKKKDKENDDQDGNYD